MLFGDEPLFKKHKHFASVSMVNMTNTSCVILSHDVHLIIVIQYYYHVIQVDPTTELKISLAKPPTTNNRQQPVGVVLRSAPVDIPKKRCI